MKKLVKEFAIEIGLLILVGSLVYGILMLVGSYYGLKPHHSLLDGMTISVAITGAVHALNHVYRFINEVKS